MKDKLKKMALAESRAGSMRAKELIQDAGVEVSKMVDFHELPSSDVDKILDAARKYKYKKPKNANGSRARMFYQFAQKAA